MEVLRNYINSIRRDFADRPLDEKSLSNNPYQVFEEWFEQAVQSQILDPYAMVIATCGNDKQPTLRTVYMRDISPNGIIFYTNYNSKKGKDLAENDKISALFLWVELDRQIRIEGVAKKVSAEKSDEYFSSRPRESCIGAWASNQSDVIESRNELEKRIKYYEEKFKDFEKIPRPDFWGGYLIEPFAFEYWQGRPSRLHDRIRFELQENNSWIKKRLSP
ncbi:MAG: pyridoxamine 5'-phosphate oxidase [Bacteroidia bacterium]